eukprot:6214786-Pleurochrysis_carterae.AAC.4
MIMITLGHDGEGSDDHDYAKENYGDVRGDEHARDTEHDHAGEQPAQDFPPKCPASFCCPLLL